MPEYLRMESEKPRLTQIDQPGVSAETLEAARSSTVGALYRRIVGDDWRNLDAAVQRLHSGGMVTRGTGSFTVTHGKRRLARLMAKILRMPAVGENVSVSLVVTAHPNGERWHRTFAGKPFITEQRDDGGKFLVERNKGVDVWFRLSVMDGALIYQQTKAALNIGHWHLPLPRRLSTYIVASERAATEKSSVQVSVRVTAPLIGLLIEYEGNIKMEEEGA